MHRYIKTFRKSGLDQKYGAVLVNYADDFVVLCRSAEHAEPLQEFDELVVETGDRRK